MLALAQLWGTGNCAGSAGLELLAQSKAGAVTCCLCPTSPTGVPPCAALASAAGRYMHMADDDVAHCPPEWANHDCLAQPGSLAECMTFFALQGYLPTLLEDVPDMAVK